MNEYPGLREFVAVVEHGSFTAAAGAMDVSTSFVSRQVRKLESRLGVRLLHRTTRRVRLTDMGQFYFDRSRAILDELASLESDMADLQQKPKGHIRMTAAGLYCEKYVAPAVAEFTTRYPEVSIDLQEVIDVVDLVEEGFDLAVRMSPMTDSSLVGRKITPRRIMVAGSPAYLARHGTPQTPDDLRQHNCLLLSHMSWRFEFPDAIRSIRVRGNWTSNNGIALATAAVLGNGLVRFPDYYLHDHVRRGELVPVLEDYEVSDAATWIAYPDRHHLPARVRFLIDFLSEKLKDNPAPILRNLMRSTQSRAKTNTPG